MIGAVIGDIIGSVYEFKGIKTKKFPLFSDGCNFTDDTIMTLAVADAILSVGEAGFLSRVKEESLFKSVLIKNMEKLAKKHPFPMGGYGGRFGEWLFSKEKEPYNSFGNGSAMRVSSCGIFADNLDVALLFAKWSAEITHNHPEGIRGAQATAACVYLANKGYDKKQIKEYIQYNFYDLDFTLDDIRADYCFDESCQGTVPQSIVAFLESKDYEDAIRNTISLGGDADTMGAITGAIASVYYGVPDEIKRKAKEYLTNDLLEILEAFEKVYE